jgi:C_GCAxxG_C_C family probable redox protein
MDKPDFCGRITGLYEPLHAPSEHPILIGSYLMDNNQSEEQHSLSKTAVERFLGGYNCAQTVFSALSPYLGLPEEEAVKIASPFGAGIGRRGLICGAVSGGIMALGLAHGPAQPCTPEQKEAIYRLAGELMDKIEAQFGSIQCREILGYDLSQSEGYAAAKAAGVFNRVCPLVVEAAVIHASSLLAEAEPE